MKSIHEQINLIAHRGLSSKYYENTLPAFLHACKSEFYGIETDIQFTGDNKIICFHDKTIRRLIGEKRKINDLKLKELLKKPFKQRSDITHKASVCTFSHYLKICKKYKKHCVIEIKYKVTAKQLNEVLKKIRWVRYMKNCIIISFNPYILKYLREKEPNLRLQLLVKNPIRRYINYCKTYKIDVSLLDRLITKDIVEKLNSNGIEVAAWTVNNKKTAQKLVNAGVSYITSDHLI